MISLFWICWWHEIIHGCIAYIKLIPNTHTHTKPQTRVNNIMFLVWMVSTLNSLLLLLQWNEIIIFVFLMCAVIRAIWIIDYWGNDSFTNEVSTDFLKSHRDEKIIRFVISNASSQQTTNMKLAIRFRCHLSIFPILSQSPHFFFSSSFYLFFLLRSVMHFPMLSSFCIS